MTKISRAGLRIGEIRVVADPVLEDLGIAVSVAVVDVEQPVGSIVGMKGQTEKALFSVVVRHFSDIEEWLNQGCPILDDVNEPIFGHDE